MSGNKVIVVGGGLSGLSAAHTVIERGGNVVSTPPLAVPSLRAGCALPRM